jgi:hypothetical protein
MANTQIYTNNRGHEITLQQAVNSETYYKLYKVDDVVKKEEKYKNNILLSTTYVIVTVSDVPSILQENPDANFRLEYIQNNYKIKEFMRYENSILNHKSTSVVDPLNSKTICFQLTDTDLNIPVVSSTEKHYYEDDELIYSFEYLENGDCLIIHDVEDPQFSIHASNIGNPGTSFTWAGFEYYQFASPVVPE